MFRAVSGMLRPAATNAAASIAPSTARCSWSQSGSSRQVRKSGCTRRAQRAARATEASSGKFCSSIFVTARDSGLRDLFGAMSLSYRARAVILTTGTFLRGAIFVGEARAAGGRAGEAPAMGLSASLAELGFPLAPGTDLDFTFRLPGDEDPVTGYGRVVRRATPSRYGVRFEGLRDDSVEKVRAFVASGEKRA